MLEMLEMLDLDILDFDNHHIAMSAIIAIEIDKHDSDNLETEKLDFQQSEIDKK